MKARRGNQGWCAALVAALVLTLLGRAHRLASADEGPPPASPEVVEPPDDTTATPQVWDPIESFNRRTFRANLAVDRWFLGPLTRGYAFVVPNPARRAVRRFLVNLWSPAIFVNDVLQLAPVDATVTLTRLAVNSTIGLA